MPGLLHADVQHRAGAMASATIAREPELDDGRLRLARRRRRRERRHQRSCARSAEPFRADGGLRLLHGNLGRAVIKVSAVEPEHRVVIEAPARVFDDQDAVKRRLQARASSTRDFVAVVRFQGPRPTACPSCTS